VSLLAQGEGFHAPGLEIFTPPCLIGDHATGFRANLFVTEFDVCVNRVTIYMFLAALIVILVFLAASSGAQLVPGRLQSGVESVVGFIREEIVLQVIGQDGLRFVPFLTALFSFILVGNLFGIIPGIQFPINSRMAIPAFLAVLSWLLFNIVGIAGQGLGYFKNALFPPGVPKPLYLLLTPIEFVSTFLVRPLTLSVRLLANMIAGHLLLTIFFVGAAYLFANPPYVFGALAFLFGAALIAFELLVAVLQAYIFTILTAVYIAGALHPEH
jgi:F-type H+-transporting ATPase subunit a